MGSVSTFLGDGWRLRAVLAFTILAAALLLPAVLAPPADAFVYWTRSNMTEDAIGRANNDGSGVDMNFITGCNEAMGVTVGGGYIYWTNYLGGTIGRARIDGTEVNQSFITGCRYPQKIDVGVSHLYWTNDGSSIGRARVDGTEVNQNVISTRAYGLAVYDNHIYWSYDEPNISGRHVARAKTDGTDKEVLFDDWWIPESRMWYGVGDLWVGSPYFYFSTYAGTIGRGETPSGLIWSLHLNKDWITGQSFLGGTFNAYNHYIYWTRGYMGEMNYIGKIRTDGTEANPTLFAAGVNIMAVDADGGSIASATQDLALGVQEHVTLPAGLKASLKAKLLAARAAYQRGAYKTTANLLHATGSEIKAQSGKAIPVETADRWLLGIEKLEKVMP